jgi:uncharacterized SAM-binding protein YcdF (DUF218 family)
MLLLGKILGAFAFPPGLIITLLVLALILVAIGRKRLGLMLGACSLAFFYLISIQPVADLLISPLENAYPPIADASRAGAVAVLGGDTQERSPNYQGRAILGPSSAVRAAYGAALARAKGIPLYYSGGAPLEAAGAESGAVAAGRFWDGLGFEHGRIRLEGASNDTTENALYLERMVPPQPLIVVTSAYHMPRSVLAFKKTKLEIMPAPADYRRKGAPYNVLDFLPSVGALDVSYHAIHEYVGLLYYLMK